MSRNKDRVITGMWYVFVFAFFVIWFTQVHPLVLFDADDWNYASYIRWAVPVWGDWNPARVFPEIFMPLVCGVSARILYPLTGDYLGAITIGSAVTVSLFIVVYVFSFDRLMRRVFEIPAEVSVMTSVGFLLLHFLVMKSKQASNQYMFYCWDLTCYYFYLIPSLLNASLVMWMSHNEGFEDFWRNGSPVRKGLFLLLVYLAIFSNLPSSGILAAFAGCKVLLALIGWMRKQKDLKDTLRRSALYFGILLGWGISALFELSGGRADAGNKDVLQAVLDILEYLSHPTVYCGKAFMFTAFLLLLSMAGIWIARKRNGENDKKLNSLVTEIVICAIALFVYMLLLIATVGWAFIQRSEYLFGLFFYLILLVMAAFVYIVKVRPGFAVTVPLMICILGSALNTPWQTYKESNMENIDPAICKQMGTDLVDQLIAADKNGATSVELYVPVSEKPFNWPYFAGKHGIAIANTLFEHGVVGSEIEVTIVPSQEMNEKYNLGLRYG